MHPLIQSVPHVGFKVDSIDEAIKGKKVILEPYYPFAGFRVAMIEVDGAPVELIETSLSEEEIWSGSKKGICDLSRKGLKKRDIYANNTHNIYQNLILNDYI